MSNLHCPHCGGVTGKVTLYPSAANAAAGPQITVFECTTAAPQTITFYEPGVGAAGLPVITIENIG